MDTHTHTVSSKLCPSRMANSASIQLWAVHHHIQVQGGTTPSAGHAEAGVSIVTAGELATVRVEVKGKVGTECWRCQRWLAVSDTEDTGDRQKQAHTHQRDKQGQENNNATPSHLGNIELLTTCTYQQI